MKKLLLTCLLMSAFQSAMATVDLGNARLVQHTAYLNVEDCLRTLSFVEQTTGSYGIKFDHYTCESSPLTDDGSTLLGIVGEVPAIKLEKVGTLSIGAQLKHNGGFKISLNTTNTSWDGGIEGVKRSLQANKSEIQRKFVLTAIYITR